MQVTSKTKQHLQTNDYKQYMEEMSMLTTCSVGPTPEPWTILIFISGCCISALQFCHRDTILHS